MNTEYRAYSSSRVQNRKSCKLNLKVCKRLAYFYSVYLHSHTHHTTFKIPFGGNRWRTVQIRICMNRTANWSGRLLVRKVLFSQFSEFANQMTSAVPGQSPACSRDVNCDRTTHFLLKLTFVLLFVADLAGRAFLFIIAWIAIFYASAEAASAPAATKDNATTQNTTCRPSEFRCLNGRCVGINKYCNNQNDCGDSSDEPRFCTRKYISSKTVYLRFCAFVFY